MVVVVDEGDLGIKSQSMDIKPEFLAILRQHQDKGYQKCSESIAKWTRFRDDYLELKKRLDTLAEKMEYDVMVPFNSVAFMPGKLVHTNEIMVLLGDNWFVERSAKQASEIVERRLAKCDSSLEELHQERKQFQTWKEHTNKMQKEIDEYVEIKEECSELEDKIWREKHKENVRKHIEAKRRNANQDVGTSSKETDVLQDHGALQEDPNYDLDELEHISSDETDQESESTSDTNENEPTEILINKSKTVRWKDDELETCFTNDRKEALNLKFPSETKTLSHAPIQSPADIYKHFASPSEPMPPKSILKSVESAASVMISDSTNKTDSISMSKLMEHSKAFSGVVHERNVSEGGVYVVDPTNTKKISKFKAQRSGQRT